MSILAEQGVSKYDIFIRKLNLSKKSAELFASRLAEMNLLQQGTKITFYCKRERDLLLFLEVKDLFFYKNVHGLPMEVDISKYLPNNCS